jgi:POT family proton-dependent oligopeptide transporter
MLIATVIFWSGRYRFAHIPAGGVAFLQGILSHESWRILARLGVIYAFVAMFWALFDQTGSSWVLQAQKMDQTFLGYRILPSQIQAANPLLIMILTPLFYYGIYPSLERRMPVTALRKIGAGMLLAAFSFAFAAWIQRALDAGVSLSIGWQLLNYVVLTASEVMVSITCLEFSYTQAPPTMKSFVMSFFMVSVAAGNLFTSAVNFFIQNPDGTSKLAGADYFWFFSLLMLATAIMFAAASRHYPEAARMADV